MNRDPLRNRKIIIFALIGIVLLGTVFVLTSLPGKDKVTTTTDTTAQPTAKEVSYDGFVKISEYGITSFQMEGIKYALYQFRPKATSFKAITSNITQSPYDPNNPTPYTEMTFGLLIDGKEHYNVVLDKYTDLVSIRIQLTDTARNVVYDSGVLDSQQLQSTATQGD